MEEGLSTTKMSCEAGKRPKKAKRSGNDNYGSVPNCKITQTRNTRPTLKQAFVFFIFQKPPKEERNGFKVYPDFGEEEGKINSM